MADNHAGTLLEQIVATGGAIKPAAVFQPVPAAPAAPAAAPAPAGEHDGELKIEAPGAPVRDAGKAEAMRKAAFDAAMGKPPAKEPEAGAEGEAADADPDIDFDEENGLDQSGRPIKGDQTAPEKGAPAEGASEKSAAADKRASAPATAEERQQLVLSRRALRLAGFSDADIDALGSARTLRMGQAATQRHSTTAAAIRDAAEIRKAAGRGDSSDAGDSTQATTGQASQSGEPDRLDALLAELEGETPPASAQAKPPKEDPALVKALAEADALREQLVARDTQDGMRKLLGDFPTLRGQESRQKLLARMDALDPDGKAAGSTTTLHQLMRDAAFIEFGPQLTERAREQRRARAHADREGQPDAAGDSNREPQRKLTADDKRRIAFETSKTNSRDESAKQYRARVGAA